MHQVSVNQMVSRSKEKANYSEVEKRPCQTMSKMKPCHFNNIVSFWISLVLKKVQFYNWVSYIRKCLSIGSNNSDCT